LHGFLLVVFQKPRWLQDFRNGFVPALGAAAARPREASPTDPGRPRRSPHTPSARKTQRLDVTNHSVFNTSEMGSFPEGGRVNDGGRNRARLNPGSSGGHEPGQAAR